MKYEVTRAPLAESAWRMEQSAVQLEAIIAQLKTAVSQLTAGNEAAELTEFKAICDGAADEELMALADALHGWSTRLRGVYQAYYQAQCTSCKMALDALNQVE